MMQVWHIHNYWKLYNLGKIVFGACDSVQRSTCLRSRADPAGKGSEFESLMPVNESRLQAGVDHWAHLPNQREPGKTHGSPGIS